MIERDRRALEKMGIRARKNRKVFVNSKSGTRYEVLGKLCGELERERGVDHWVLSFTSSLYDNGTVYISVSDFKWAIEYREFVA
jgi:hypothetical protein